MASQNTSCNTCYGYGLWPDGTAPMGSLDAEEGLGTIACPECGKNPNPTEPWPSDEETEQRWREGFEKLWKETISKIS